MNSCYLLFPDDGFILTYGFCIVPNFSVYKSLRLLEIFGSEGIFLFAKKKLKKNSSMYFKRK